MLKWLTLLLCFTAISQLFSQDIVNLSQFNASQLNQYLIDYTNKLRARKRQDSLAYYPQLDAAAQNHADYMAEREYLGHVQKNKKTKTVKDRVVFFGGDAEIVGENVQYISIDYEIQQAKNKLTYLQLAKILGDQWKKSRGHYLNMIDGKYQGVSHQFAIKDGLLYACQVFSSKPFQPEFKYQKGKSFSVKEKPPCLNCKRITKKYNKNRVHYGWYHVSNDSLYYHNLKKIRFSHHFALGERDFYLPGRTKNMRAVFKRKGKLSVDFIHISQYDCQGNAIYDAAPNYDGYYLGYIDKQRIKKENLSTSPDFVKLYLGQIPEVPNEKYQVDFNLTKKDRPCSNQSLVFTTPLYFLPSDFFELRHPTIKIGSENIISDSIIVKVPFSRSKITEDTASFTELKTVLNNLKNDSVRVVKVHYTGIASIEGTEAINKKLIDKRAETISQFLLSSFPIIKMSHELIENFEDFRIGLQALKGEKMADETEDNLRIYANKHKNKQKIANLLDDTRQSEVVIYTERSFSAVELNPSLANLKQLIQTNEPTAALLVWQQLTKVALNNDSLLLKKLVDLSVPENRQWADLLWEHFVLNVKTNAIEVTPERLKHLHQFGAIPSNANYLAYRYLFNLFGDVSTFPTDDYAAVMADIKSKTTKNWLQCLHIINEVEQGRLPSNQGSVLARLVASGRFSAKQTYFVSQYMIKYGDDLLALSLLKQYAKQPNHFPLLYQQYLKLSYYFTMFENRQAFKAEYRALVNLSRVSKTDFCEFFKWYHIGVRCLEINSISDLYCKKCR